MFEITISEATLIFPHQLLKNHPPRLGMLVGTLDKMDEAKRNIHLENAEKYLSSL